MLAMSVMAPVDWSKVTVARASTGFAGVAPPSTGSGSVYGNVCVVDRSSVDWSKTATSHCAAVGPAGSYAWTFVQ